MQIPIIDRARSYPSTFKMTHSLLHSLSYLSFLAALASADISVRVVDPSHAPIPGATISLISRNGGENRKLTTDANGSCRFQTVANGQYLLQSEAFGFDASRPQLLELRSDELSELTISLGVAQVRASVSV